MKLGYSSSSNENNNQLKTKNSLNSLIKQGVYDKSQNFFCDKKEIKSLKRHHDDDQDEIYEPKKFNKLNNLWHKVSNFFKKPQISDVDTEKFSVNLNAFLHSIDSSDCSIESYPEHQIKSISINVIEKAVPFFDIKCGGQYAGRICFKLYWNVCPRTCSNFERLCAGREKQLSHAKTPLWYKVIPRFVIQGGDILFNDGAGGECVYARESGSKTPNFFFEDENFVIKHHTSGMLAMANFGPNTNQSQFYITCAPLPWLNDKCVVFGRVIKGLEVLAYMEKLGSDSGQTAVDIYIEDSGVLESFETSSPENQLSLYGTLTEH